MSLLVDHALVVLVPTSAVGVGAAWQLAWRWRAEQRQRRTRTWIESIETAMVEERLRALVERSD
jgi:hypothetical protein